MVAAQEQVAKRCSVAGPCTRVASTAAASSPKRFVMTINVLHVLVTSNKHCDKGTSMGTNMGTRGDI